MGSGPEKCCPGRWHGESLSVVWLSLTALDRFWTPRVSKTRARKRQTSGRLRVPKTTTESAESLPVIGPILGDFGFLGLQNHGCERIPTKGTEMIAEFPWHFIPLHCMWWLHSRSVRFGNSAAHAIVIMTPNTDTILPCGPA